MTPKTFIGMNLLLAGVLFASNALACSTAAWSPGESGDVTTNDPVNGVPRVSGACGFKVTGVGHVQDNSPNAETQFIGRFYFYPQLSGTGSTDIFVAYSDEASVELFSVKYDGTNITIDATAASGESASIPVSSNHWHLIEFSWKTGEPGALWVDADATKESASITFASGTGAIESIRLGAPNGFGGLAGMAFFDDYESHRSLPVGALLAGDSNQNGAVDSDDVTAIVDEFLFNTYPGGVTDCDLDGEINSGDVNCAVTKF
jgi:hypothetical protein